MRPSIGEQILTDEMIERVGKIIEIGAYVETACEASGLQSYQYHNYMRQAEAELKRLEKGGKPNNRYERRIRFYKRIKKALADAEHSLLRIIVRSSIEKSNWQAAAWILERSRPQRWGKKSEYNVTTEATDGKKKKQGSLQKAFEEVLKQ